MSGKPFVLSVKIAIMDDKDRCLLLRRSPDSKANPGKWDLPGGKLDPCEGFEHALLREVLEETGLEIVVDKVAAAAQSENEKSRIAYLLFQGHAKSDEVKLSEEHVEYAWVERTKLPETDICQQFLPFAMQLAESK